MAVSAPRSSAGAEASEVNGSSGLDHSTWKGLQRPHVCEAFERTNYLSPVCEPLPFSIEQRISAPPGKHGKTGRCLEYLQCISSSNPFFDVIADWCLKFA